jgi:hypothetical protein
VLELAADDVSYGAIDADTFAVKPPEGTRVVEIDPVTFDGRGRPTRARGVAAVQRRLPFDLSAPGRLAGLPRTDVRLLDVDGSLGAVSVCGGAWADRRPPVRSRSAGLADRGKDKVSDYSHSMRQRLGIAGAPHTPRLVLLDEPTTGLDPAGMRDMRADPAACDQGIIVLLSSHLMAEVEELGDRVAIIGPP